MAPSGPRGSRPDEQLPAVDSAGAGPGTAPGGAPVAAQPGRSPAEVRALKFTARNMVWSLLPLGCCFLPAFVCLGVIPVIIGVAGQVSGYSN